MIQFYREFEGLGFKEACRKAGVEREYQAPRQSLRERLTRSSASRSGHVQAWEPVRHELPPERWQEKAGGFAAWCASNLEGSRLLLDWLEEARGLRLETIRRFNLGWNPGEKGRDLYRQVTHWGLPFERNERGKERSIWLPVGLTIPVYSCPDSVELVRVKIRRPKRSDGLPADVATPYEDGPGWARQAPYVAVRGSSDHTFVLHPESRVFVVVESELDALLLAQDAGDIAGAVALGSATAKPDATATELLRRAGCILVALDAGKEPGGDPGEAAAWQWWLPQFPNAERWPVPAGKDPNEARLAGVDLREWVLAGLPTALARSVVLENESGASGCEKTRPGAERPSYGPGGGPSERRCDAPGWYHSPEAEEIRRKVQARKARFLAATLPATSEAVQ
ncbi:hypothetical protein [Oceanidesulfovibrio marinus]|uniref:hypothetical protein n=1 Tax=Oceanidesulfovibrio marinus TaxID=370038 RepID=UPI001F372A25|nr:hypothetical protein [Oceanidesulfovibrio marinus]